MWEVVLETSLGALLDILAKSAPELINDVKQRFSEAERSMTLTPAAQEAIKQLMSVPSLRIAGSHDFKRATPLLALSDGTTVSRFVNPAQCEHIFFPKMKSIFLGVIHCGGGTPT